MPTDITVIEHDRTSRSGSVDDKGSSSTYVYKAFRSDDRAAIRLAVAAVAPLTDDFGCLRMGAEFDPKGGGVWEVKVKYEAGQRVGQDPNSGQGGKQPGLEEGIGQETTFDTTGGTQHITQSISTVDEFKATADEREIPDTRGAIGLSEHGVEGCEIIIPSFTWTETWRFPAFAINWQYVIRLRDMTGKVNELPWRNFEPGEVLYAGASGHPEGPDWVKIAFTFRAEKNRFGEPNPETGEGSIVLAPGFDPIEKDGWDYLWVGYEEDVQDTAKVQRPRFAKVEQVYYRRDFRLLGLGT